MPDSAIPRSLKIHRPEDFASMRVAGRLAAATLDMITDHVRPSIPTEALDRLCHDFIVAQGAIPASLNYHGYSHATCISVNHVACHGIPGDQLLANGDIVNIDLAVIVDGWHGDSSRMYAVGTPNVRARRLMDVTYDAMMRGIEVIRPGATIGDIGFAMQRVVEAARFSMVRDFCGHGIGRRYHDLPDVLNYGRRGEGTVLAPGMFLTVEPMVNAGKPDVKILSDGWTAVSLDRSLSAQFEHTVGVTEDGVEIFTLSPAGYSKPPYEIED